MDLITKELSPESKMKVVLSGGKIVLSADFASSGLKADLSAALDTDYFLDELAKAIPGQLDDAIIAVLKGALKSIA
jgi:hypothetical protein